MTKKELEQRVAELERRLAAVERTPIVINVPAQPVVQPVWVPSVSPTVTPTYPWQSPWVVTSAYLTASGNEQTSFTQ